jgi:hypothetical protein
MWVMVLETIFKNLHVAVIRLIIEEEVIICELRNKFIILRHYISSNKFASIRKILQNVKFPKIFTRRRAISVKVIVVCIWKSRFLWTDNIHFLVFVYFLHSIIQTFTVNCRIVQKDIFNPLNTELNPICHLLVLLGAQHILHISRIRGKHRVKSHLPSAGIIRISPYSPH